MAGIGLERLRKVFPGGHVALDDLTLDIAEGERLAIVGPSGSGKSTVLRLVAGLDEATSGRVLVNGMDVTHLPPESRNLAMVFQSYALYPHMTVRANLAFGLRVRGTARDERERRVNETADALGIATLLDRLPSQLSGGQRQRVAVGRAIVRDPAAFLFDEPLSNLDPRLRGDVRSELVRLHARLGRTMLHVTHDQEEAMTLGQRIAVLREGRLEQTAPPDEIYAEPATVFVAGFIGSPPMNFLRGRVAERDGRAWLDADVASIAIPSRGATGGKPLTLGIRPHDVKIVEPGAAEIVGRIELVEMLGHAQVAHVVAEGLEPLRVVTPPDQRLELGRPVGLKLPPDRQHLFDEEGRRIGGRHGTRRTWHP